MKAPVILVGDIDRGGVFAQIVGNLALLEESERAYIKGILVNKFRGNPELFKDGKKILEEKTGIPVIGVIPYMEIRLEEEDSLFEKENFAVTREERDVEYDKIADLLVRHCDMKKINQILEEGI